VVYPKLALKFGKAKFYNKLKIGYPQRGVAVPDLLASQQTRNNSQARSLRGSRFL